MRVLIKALGFAGFTAGLAFAAPKEASGPSGYAAIEPVRLNLASKTWSELQFIQADAQGRVSVLRGSPALEVYGLENGALRFKESFEGATAGAKSGEMWVEHARLNRAGDAWFLFTKPITIEVFEGAKRTQTVKSHWEVTDLAENAAGLVVAVSNNEIDTSTPEGPGLNRPPLVRSWDGRRWETFIQGEYRNEETRPGASWRQLDMAAYSVYLAFSPEEQLWAANAFASRLRHFSASGLLEDEIASGDGKVHWLDLKPEDVAKQQTKIDAAVVASGLRATMGARSTISRNAYRGLAVGRDGYVYLLTEAEEGLALDRYLPSLPTYERVLLTGVDLGPGRPSFVAGRYALFLCARLGQGGTWEIPNEYLVSAKWKSVPGVTRNGIEIEDPHALNTASGARP